MLKNRFRSLEMLVDVLANDKRVCRPYLGYERDEKVAVVYARLNPARSTFRVLPFPGRAVTLANTHPARLAACNLACSKAS